MRRAGLVALVLLWGCSGGSDHLPPPTLLGVEPAQLPVNAKDEPLTVRFQARYPVTVDYDKETVDSRATASGQVWLDAKEARVTRFDPEGVIEVTLPRGLGAGAHALRLRLEDGREAVAEDALTLVPPGKDKGDLPEVEDAGVLIALDAGPVESDVDAGDDADAGPVESHLDAGTPDDAGTDDGPIQAGDVTGYTFDPIEGAKTSRVAFTLTVRAEGPRAARFEGSVELTATRGTVEPSKIGPCDDGVCRATVYVDASPGSVRLRALDAFGAGGTSNTFTLVAPTR